MYDHQFQYWPIFQENDQTKSFWNKQPQFNINQSIISQFTMNRITWKCSKPTEYQFLLNQEGLLFYQHNNNKPKGYVLLNLDISLKIIDLKISNKKTDLVKTYLFIFGIMISKIINYLFFRKSTFQFFKNLSQFSFIQNLDQVYTFSDVIAKGGFSKVIQLTPNIRLPNQPLNYAGKIYYREELIQKKDSQKFYNFIHSECYVLRKLNSPYIIKLFEIIQLDEMLILVTEYIKGGSLYQYLKEKKKLTEIESTQILLKLTIALQAVNSIGYVHRDIKLENVLIDKDNIKLIDFGFTEKIQRDRLQNGQGTAGYIAPEVFMRQPYQEVGDIFSLGVIFYSMLCGRAPFRSNTYDGLLKLNKECQIDFSESKFVNVSQKSIYLLKAMLQKQPENRITVQDLLVQLQAQTLVSHFGNIVSTQSIIEGSVGMSFNHLQSKNTLKSFYQQSQHSASEHSSQLSEYKQKKRRFKSQSMDKKGYFLKQSSFKPSLKNIYQMNIEQSNEDNLSNDNQEQPIQEQNLYFLQFSYYQLNRQKFV
ncbi:unnamed protein product [Paramecium pentaurelia]|uniref:Protein kinase domain-containing protein n=1 Tax=Paramecium pentaurelia TaxID=43138 RepID=A0A8S1X1Y4_9CILI|nr:unnamed protein product [Paramecium pentaurelia]